MNSKKIGRRKFIKRASSAVLGLAAVPFWDEGLSFAEAVTPKYRILGKTGLKVTSVGVGAMNCGDPAVLRRAFDLGINFYDTAHSYMAGRNEELVGRVFRGKRDKVLIQTKIQFHSSEKQNRQAIETSLRRLQTDHVDALLAHNLRTVREVANPALIDFLQAIKKEGKARFTGFSSHSNMGPLLREAAKSNLHDVALVSYNFTHSDKLKDAVATAAKSGIGVVAMKTQSGGYKKKDMGGLNPHQAALKYVLMDRNIAAAIPGVRTIQQIEECAGVMGAALSRKDAHALRDYQSYLQGRICTMCGGCSGECPHGVAHTDLMRIIMYHDGYKNDMLVQEVLRSGDALQEMSRCSKCSSCVITCRRGLDIKAQIEAAYKLFA